jgi:hypothetical protein
MGVSVIPFFCLSMGKCVSCSKRPTGRKVGYLIDFCGGLGEVEHYRETAIRDFVDETATIYFSSDALQASLNGGKRQGTEPQSLCIAQIATGHFSKINSGA